jgi:DNA polymerase III epsilon subunit-like protein
LPRDKSKFSESAIRTHGLTYEKLEQKGARLFTKQDAKDIVEFLPEGSKVIAHNWENDRETLMNAFDSKRGGVGVYLPKWEKTCT